MPKTVQPRIPKILKRDAATREHARTWLAAITAPAPAGRTRRTFKAGA